MFIYDDTPQNAECLEPDHSKIALDYHHHLVAERGVSQRQTGDTDNFECFGWSRAGAIFSEGADLWPMMLALEGGGNGAQHCSGVDDGRGNTPVDIDFRRGRCHGEIIDDGRERIERYVIEAGAFCREGGVMRREEL